MVNLFLRENLVEGELQLLGGSVGEDRQRGVLSEGEQEVARGRVALQIRDLIHCVVVVEEGVKVNFAAQQWRCIPPVV